MFRFFIVLLFCLGLSQQLEAASIKNHPDSCAVPQRVVISPNGDGVEDTWVISCSERFFQLEVKVLNRWGQMLFHDKDYQNDWNGHRDGQKLPREQYIYIIVFPDGTEQKGSLVVL